MEHHCHTVVLIDGISCTHTGQDTGGREGGAGQRKERGRGRIEEGRMEEQDKCMIHNYIQMYMVLELLVLYTMSPNHQLHALSGICGHMITAIMIVLASVITRLTIGYTY